MTTVWCWKHAPSSFFVFVLLWKNITFSLPRTTRQRQFCQFWFLWNSIPITESLMARSGFHCRWLWGWSRVALDHPSDCLTSPPGAQMCLFNLLVLFIPQDRLWVPKWSKLKYGENRTTISEHICRRLDSKHAVGLAKSADASLPEFSSSRAKWYWICLEEVGLDETVSPLPTCSQPSSAL